MKLLLNVLILSFFLISSSSPLVTSGIEEDMVYLDRAYIPVVYYLHQGDIASAKRALICLERTWKKFDRNYKKKYNEDDWREHFRAINDWIDGSQLALRKRDIQMAGAQIENVKYELMCLREEEGINHFFDYLWDFEESVFMVESIVNDPKIELYEWNELESFVNEMNKHWVYFEKQQYDVVMLPFIKANEVEVLRSQKDMSKVLIEFTKVLLAANRLELQRAVHNLRPAYLNVLHAYGNFEATKIYYAYEEYWQSTTTAQ